MPVLIDIDQHDHHLFARAIPKGYFDAKAEGILTTFRREAVTNRSPEFFAGFPTDRLAKDVRNVWQSPATRIYRNWLLYLEAQRVER
jgi:homoserine O-succinyltransferase